MVYKYCISPARRGLDGNIIKKGKLETIMLDGKVLKAENYEEDK